MERSDSQLITAYLNGDRESLDILIKRYLKPIYGFVFSLVGDKQEAEDIAQESFLKVWRNLKKFDRNKNFKPWIMTIAKNTSIDYFKKKKSMPFSSFDNDWGGNSLFDRLIDNSPSPEEYAGRVESAGRLSLALEGLSPGYRRVLSLRYDSDLTFREIAERLGESVNTVKTRHRRALSTLSRLFSK